jgi:hypothetical protein
MHTKRIVQTLLESAAVLVVGFAIIGSLMFAFSQNAKANGSDPHQAGSKIEVTITDAGHALVRGAEVTNVTGGTVTAKTAWGASALTWTVQTDGDTDFLRKNGAGTALADIAVGDVVSFSGAIDQGAGAFVVHADAVKDWSKDDQKTVFAGTVASVDDAAGTFVLATKQNGSVTVRTTGDTGYGSGKAFSDVDVDDTVVVSGAFDDGTDTLTAAKISFDLKSDVKTSVKENWKEWAKKLPILNWFGTKGHK